MSERGTQLYSPQLLELALRLAQWPWNESLPLYGQARSPVCGSQIHIGLETAPDGAIARIALRTQTCVVGQAACAIFAEAAAGCSVDDLRQALADIEDWLAGHSPLPDWPGMSPLIPAQGYPGRHGAIMLPWRAALAALQ